MASNKVFRFGPVFIANAVGNLLNPDTTSGGVNDNSTGLYIVLKHVQIVNKTGSAVTFTCYLGATGGSASGTEVFGGSRTVAANSSVEFYPNLRLDVADFLTGVASSASALVILGTGEIGVAG